jgi:hypothetical protein
MEEILHHQKVETLEIMGYNGINHLSTGAGFFRNTVIFVGQDWATPFSSRDPASEQCSSTLCIYGLMM